MYDVIVIGAGPSGSTAAKILAENGFSVLLTEKFTLPRYKSCSGCLIKKTIDLVRLYYNADIPHEITCSPAENKGMIITDGAGRSYTFPHTGLNVWRSKFDHWLAKKAVESGAVLKDNAPVLMCEQDAGSVKVYIGGEHNYIERARYVVDCEGITGTIRNKLLGCRQQTISTYQTYNTGNIALDTQYFYAYLQPEFSEYDAWFNVKDDMIVLGVSAGDPSKIPEFYRSFIGYMEREHGLVVSKLIKEDKWLLPRIQPGCDIDYALGRIFFSGETAGWLNPMGEGISCGMESSYHLAQAILQNYDHTKSIEAAYHKRSEQLREYMIRQWSLIGKMSASFAEMI